MKKIREIKIVGDYAYIELSQGKTAIIDSLDVCLVDGLNWSAMKGSGGIWYAYSGLMKKRLHQVILKTNKIDHIDGDGLNNRRSNLRPASPLENARNRKVRIESITGYKGVNVRPGEVYRSRITTGGRRLHLGDYKTPEAAALAYDEAALKYFGDFARLNFPKREDGDVSEQKSQ